MNLEILNSVTKYPSIETYHVLGEKGRLTDKVTPFTGEVFGYEKVDGTNGRIILLPGGDYFIGSREELLHAKGDRVVPSTGVSHDIVTELRPVAENLCQISELSPELGVVAVYLEVYGSKIGGQAKQYTGSGSRGHRMFDVLTEGPQPFEWDRETISRWRENGGQTFLSVEQLDDVSRLTGIPRVPHLCTVMGYEMPETHFGTHRFLSNTLPQTRVALDEKGHGSPEGIVFRSADRSVIRKARFADYRRTMNIG